MKETALEFGSWLLFNLIYYYTQLTDYFGDQNPTQDKAREEDMSFNIGQELEEFHQQLDSSFNETCRCGGDESACDQFLDTVESEKDKLKYVYDHMRNHSTISSGIENVSCDTNSVEVY